MESDASTAIVTRIAAQANVVIKYRMGHSNSSRPIKSMLVKSTSIAFVGVWERALLESFVGVNGRTL